MCLRPSSHNRVRARTIRSAASRGIQNARSVRRLPVHAHACMHMHILMCSRVCMHVCLHALYVHMYLCLHAYIRALAGRHARICACFPARLRVHPHLCQTVVCCFGRPATRVAATRVAAPSLLVCRCCPSRRSACGHTTTSALGETSLQHAQLAVGKARSICRRQAACSRG